MSLPVTLIFPMAGQGARFGYRFKPFLDVKGQPFIAAAFAPFRSFLSDIARTHFVFTAEQEAAHRVSARLGQMFADVPHESAILPAPTNGPAETLRQCLAQESITGPILVCDCDHALDVRGLMAAAADPAIACALPTWDLEGQSLAAWSVAAVEADGRVSAIREKALPAGAREFRGVIGCYYFADAEAAGRAILREGMVHVSDLVAHCIAAGLPVLSVPVEKACFFGDPERLAAAQA